MNATRYFPLGGRLFIDRPFVASGLSEPAACRATAAVIVSSNFPPPSPLAYARAVTVEPGWGLVIAGDQTGVAVVVPSLYCLPTGVSFHSNLPDRNQELSFIKNVILAGGLLQIVALGAGTICVDNRHSKGRAGEVALAGWCRSGPSRGDKASFGF
jgi:putative oxidoreductase